MIEIINTPLNASLKIFYYCQRHTPKLSWIFVKKEEILSLLKKIVKTFLPPICLSAANMLRRNQSILWQGNFNSWNEALNNCDGYDSNLIFEKVKISTEMVIRGEVPYERDSVPLKEIEYSWPLMSGLLLASTYEKGTLELIDFGGSLGSVYFQSRKLLKDIPINWHVVEQPHFVDYGRANIKLNNLYFHHSIEDVFKISRPSTILFSSVLQYLENPFVLLDQVFNLSFQTILIDRTPFHLKGDHKIRIQKVPASIYKASYPCWIFSEEKLESYFMKNYDLIEKFKSSEINESSFNYSGYIFRKKNNEL